MLYEGPFGKPGREARGRARPAPPNRLFACREAIDGPRPGSDREARAAGDEGMGLGSEPGGPVNPAESGLAPCQGKAVRPSN